MLTEVTASEILDVKLLDAKRFCGSYAKQPSRNKPSLDTTSITEPVWTETHFRNFVEGLRKEEARWLSTILSSDTERLLSSSLWSSPIVITIFTFWACCLMRIPQDTSTVFTFLATVRIVEEPIRLLPDVAGIFIESKFVLTRIVKFLAEPELPKRSTEGQCKYIELSILIKEATFSWHVSSSHATLENIDLNVKPGKKIAICGEVGSGKLTLLAEILGEVSSTQGTVQVYGKVAYVSQNRMDTNRNYVREYTLRVINGSREVPKSTEKVFTCTTSENSSMW
ncbi:ABC transporter C family member 10-like [Heracleum sosnowskyi]|uniref:ABC transporter C family member 10-like n=1 Tax=Heracleum sosnowskyi TaxID=360622 RepID=A0AAD8HSN6_9APIA|nr:ABC transporter C family member 10-like [Heracleum sosnowskyi]